MMNQMIAEVQIQSLMNRYAAAAREQSRDALRAEYQSVGAQLVASLKKMSSLSLARKFRKVFGFDLCFNVFNADDDERQSMIFKLYNAAMVREFGAYVPEQNAQIAKQAMMSLCLKPQNAGRFDERQIINIRIARLCGQSYRSIGRQYGVSGDMVRSICIGESYKDVAKELIVR